MEVRYIQHSCFLVETDRFYFLFDYHKGQLPEMDRKKPIFVFSSHGHSDHYNPEIFPLLSSLGMESVQGILSDDIPMPETGDILQVAANRFYQPVPGVTVTTFRSTDLGVAFLIDADGKSIYHAGDLNDWVWEGEPDADNRQMTADYQKEIRLLAQTLNGRRLHAAFVVLDPRQEADYHRGLSYFLETVSAEKVYPMHDWGHPEIIETFLKDHPQYSPQIQKRG